MASYRPLINVAVCAFHVSSAPTTFLVSGLVVFIRIQALRSNSSRPMFVHLNASFLSIFIYEPLSVYILSSLSQSHILQIFVFVRCSAKSEPNQTDHTLAVDSFVSTIQQNHFVERRFRWSD